MVVREQNIDQSGRHGFWSLRRLPALALIAVIATMVSGAIVIALTRAPALLLDLTWFAGCL